MGKILAIELRENESTYIAFSAGPDPAERGTFRISIFVNRCCNHNILQLRLINK
jgi:hypothetical protein